ncbi:nitronate monooxygenase [Acidaminobacter hydrogenoformans]|uniref:Probable nitronate monooxygenase n=1 Tax=Acidaminobacter hydrogenoformans DSM 2784 TaxID=1120920 RepID=A0A1G5RVN4_9FIRM|nr:nitronate monooxygenase [Acidaminobacter hydrogenoformans]SCZ78174.1 enoyl-[acyl-carrier protein] reductase II [Acidaminobacter hydrogenoformans DSM 2784]
MSKKLSSTAFEPVSDPVSDPAAKSQSDSFKDAVHNPLTRLLGTAYPILQGAMAWVSESTLAAAVSNAGGAGIIAAGGREASWVKEEIQKARTMTGRPFGVNVPLISTPEKEAIINVLCESGIDFVTLGAGDPLPYLRALKASGIKVGGIVPSLRLAKKLETAGVDFIILEGMEAGGKIGKSTTLSLMTNVIPELHVPVVAAGGFASGRGLAAALVMGAHGIQMGTRFILANECQVHPDYKNAIMDATDEDSVILGTRYGKATRCIRSAFTDKYLALEAEGGSPQSLETMMRGASRRMAMEGAGVDGMNGIALAGQSLSQLNDLESAEWIIRDIMGEARAVLENCSLLK